MSFKITPLVLQMYDTNTLYICGCKISHIWFMIHSGDDGSSKLFLGVTQYILFLDYIWVVSKTAVRYNNNLKILHTQCNL